MKQTKKKTQLQSSLKENNASASETNVHKSWKTPANSVSRKLYRKVYWAEMIRSVLNFTKQLKGNGSTQVKLARQET